MPDFLIYQESKPLLFTQVNFWIFFAIIIIFYQVLYQRLTLRSVFLMLTSLYFYYLSSGWLFSLLIFSTIVDYYIGNAIYNSNNQKFRTRMVALSVTINLSVLAYFKYAYFFTDSMNQFLGMNWQVTDWLGLTINSIFGTQINTSRIILPVGISFYTFQTISYSVDIYRKKLTPVKNIFDFAFFVSFFPQLVAGPIVRASDFIPQIYTHYRLSQQEFGRAIYLIMVGLFKKMFISDYVSINYVDRIFENPEAYSGFQNLMGVYGYTIQIYCDFSGYTDIAIGIALLLGFRLPLNFNSPYKAFNITDFWRRWHISLSSWLRDYLYISMGGNRKGKLKTYLFLMITMLLGGLWHGAHGRFILWGLMHGVALAIHKIWMEFFPPKKSEKRKITFGNLLAGFLTFHFVCLCWIYFRAQATPIYTTGMDVAHEILFRILTDFRVDLIWTSLIEYQKVYSVILLGFVLHWLPYNFKTWLSETFIELPDLSKAIALIFLVLVIYQVVNSEIQPFIYFQF